MLKKATPYILTAPLILLIALMLISFINIIIQSLGYIPALGLFSVTFNYYKEIFLNTDFLNSTLLSLYVCVISSVFSVIIGVIICVALVYLGKGSGFLNYIVRIPVLIPHGVVALFVITMFSGSGIISRIFYNVGIIATLQEFPSLIYNEAGVGIIIGYIWKQAPFVAFFTLSLMDNISKTLEEAAINLGASPIKAFFKITLPLSMPAILNSLLIITAFSFGAYELPFLLGMTKPKALSVQAYIEYTHPDLAHRPYAMAMNGIIVIIALFISVLYFLLMRKALGRLNNEKK